MKSEFLVAVRNDHGQILVLVLRESGTPVFPGGLFDSISSPILSIVKRQVIEDTGLEVMGLHLVSVRAPTHVKATHRYTAYVAGGKLRTPPSDIHSSASWVAPELVLKIDGLAAAAKDLVRDAAWMLEGPPR
jgi:hypothetical protein